MKKEAMTRREVITFLGFKLPVVLLAVETLPGIARAGEEYTRKTFLATPARRDEALNAMDSDDKITITAHRDKSGRPVGSRILSLDDKPADLSHFKPGTVIYKVNDEPFIIRSQKDFGNWMNSIKEMVQNKQTMTFDLDMDGKPYLYVFEFE